MIRGFLLQRVAALFGSVSGKPPVSADAQKDGDGNTHDQQAAEAKDDEPPDHPHDELGYQTLPGVGCGVHARMRLFYFEVPFADLADS